MVQKPQTGPPKPGNKDDRNARLAENLRANLRRRKSQSRAMSDEDRSASDEPE
jgi:hypothetical protein